MAQPFLGEIRVFSFNFPPKTWALCNGQLMSIQQNAALFSILGTTYGGNGVQTFALPNLQGRIPYHAGAGITLGQTGGEEFHTLISTEMPLHNHIPMASSAASPDQGSPAGNRWVTQPAAAYAASGGSSMSGATIALAGGGQPHENRPPYFVLNYCIALSGIFPSRN